MKDNERDPIRETIETYQVDLVERWRTPVATLFLGRRLTPEGFEYVLILPKSLEDSLYHGFRKILLVSDDVLARASSIEQLAPGPKGFGSLLPRKEDTGER